MEHTQAPRLIYLAQAFRTPWLATVVAAMGSIAIYTIIHSLLGLPFPLTTGMFIAAIIPLLIGHPIFVLISTQNGHIHSQNRRLKELNEQKNVLLSLIAHDMRSPLAHLKQSLDYATEDNDYAKDVLADFPAITRRVDKTLSLLDNLLTWSRGSFHREAGESEEVALRPLVDRLVQQLQDTLQDKQLALHNYIDDRIILHTQTDLINMVLRNLMTNAIKYTPEQGHIDIDCCEDGQQLCLSIADSGIGMDEKTLGQLFSSERAGSKPGTRGETGSGIGLLLSKQLLHSIGGSIRVESKQGQGSTFYVTLPQYA